MTRSLRVMLDAVGRTTLTYGFSEQADYRIIKRWTTGPDHVLASRCSVPTQMPLQVELNMPGMHNVLNATAAIAVACELGLSDAAIRAGLRRFQGVGRRFQITRRAGTARGQRGAGRRLRSSPHGDCAPPSRRRARPGPIGA